MTEQMTVRGTLKGHNGWVTQIATTPQFPDMILSASRGKRFSARYKWSAIWLTPSMLHC